MAYFNILNLGKSFSQYNKENLDAFFKKEKSKNILDDSFKHYLKGFEPDDSYKQLVHDLIHHPESESGKKAKKYYGSIRKLLYSEGFEKTIERINKDEESLFSKKYLGEFEQEVRSRRIDFWESLNIVIFYIWKLYETRNNWNLLNNEEKRKCRLEAELSREIAARLTREIDEYFWNELYIRVFTDDKFKHDKLNHSKKDEVISNVYEFIDFHLFNSIEAIDFIEHLKELSDLKPNDAKNLRVKAILNSWINEKTIELGLSLRVQENNKNEQNNNLSNISNQNQIASPPLTKLFLNKTNDLAIYVYFLGKLGVGTEISLSKHEKSKVEYEKYITRFNAQYFRGTDKGFKLESLISQINLIGDFIEGRNNPSSRNEIVEKIKRVQKQLIQDYPNKSDNIKELLSPFL